MICPVADVGRTALDRRRHLFPRCPGESEDESGSQDGRESRACDVHGDGLQDQLLRESVVGRGTALELSRLQGMK